MTPPWYFCKARDLLLSIPRVDLHLHTNYTDGRSTVREYLEAAAQAEIRAIAFCEHVDRKTQWLPTFQQEVQHAGLGSPDILVLAGVEVRADGFSGELNAEESLLDQAGLVMGVVHRYPNGRGSVREMSEVSREEACELEYRAAMSILENPCVRILGHPGGSFEKHFGEFPLPLYEEIVDKADDRGVAVELNPAYQHDFRGFVQLCLRKNALVSIGSNAHSAQEIGHAMRAVGEALAEHEA
jgi:putative hydrolase